MEWNFTMCLLASYGLYQLDFPVGICLDVSACLMALALQQFSVGKTNCSLCDFCTVRSCVCAYIQHLCRQIERKRAKWTTIP